MNTRALLVGLFTCAAFTSASSQANDVTAKRPGAISPVARCRAEGSAYQSKALGALRAAGTALTAAIAEPVVAEARRITRVCTDKLSPDTLQTADLTALASLDISTGDTASARRTVKVLLAKPGLPDEDRASALLVSQALAIRSFDPFLGRNPDAERIVTEVEALAGATLSQKIEAHRALLHRYDYADYDDGILQHSVAVIAMAKRALATHALGMTGATPNSPSVDMAYPVMAEAYVTRARAAGDQLHADSALMILDEAKRVVGENFAIAEMEFAPSRRMYQLVGTRATPIDGQWWINNPTGVTVTPGTGNVSLIQFTAHWCVPCKHSYPGMVSMSNHFAGQKYESVMVTELYGFIGARQNLSAEQEVAADQAYYTTEHHLPMKVAITPQRAEGDTTTNDNDHRYAVGGIPQIVVVDKKGVIRATVVGWDNGNEKRLTAFIEKLLAEK